MQKNSILIIVPLVLAALVLVGLQDAGAAARKEKVVVAVMIYGKQNVKTLEGFKAGMHDKGYIEGENISYIFDGPYLTKDDLEADMVKLAAHGPDLIMASTTPVALAAKKATEAIKIPVLFGPVNDPVQAGIVRSQKQPGDNITGVMLTDSTAKQLEWTLRVSPKIKRVLLPYNPHDKSSVISLHKVREASHIFGLDLVVRETESHADIDALLADLPEGIDAIFLPRDGMIMTRVEDFAEVCRQKGLALSGTRSEMAKRGALLGFGFDGFEVGRQMARLADLILSGKNPGDLPVETAEDYLLINLKTAKAMGLTIDDHILRQAHAIIR